MSDLSKEEREAVTWAMKNPPDSDRTVSIAAAIKERDKRDFLTGDGLVLVSGVALGYLARTDTAWNAAIDAAAEAVRRAPFGFYPNTSDLRPGFADLILALRRAPAQEVEADTIDPNLRTGCLRCGATLRNAPNAEHIRFAEEHPRACPAQEVERG